MSNQQEKLRYRILGKMSIMWEVYKPSTSRLVFDRIERRLVWTMFALKPSLIGREK